MSLQVLMQNIHDDASTVTFQMVMDAIAESYHYTPTRFSNGLGDEILINEAGTNEGSCRIFALAQLHNLTVQQTLHCFGDFYRSDVLGNPEGTDHGNIRSFMRYGWEGIQFDQTSLVAK